MNPELETKLMNEPELSGNYSFLRNFPVLSLLLIAARKGFTIDKSEFFFNYTPDSMELVYLVSFGIQEIHVEGTVLKGSPFNVLQDTFRK